MLPVLMILCAGCIKMEQTLIIQQDGSGSLEAVYALSEDSVNQVKAALKIQKQIAAIRGEAGASGGQDDGYAGLFLNPSETLLRRELKKYEKNGITIDKLKVESREAWRHVHIKLLFKSLDAASKADFFQEYGFSLSRNTDANYTFFRPSEDRDEEKASPISDAEMLQRLSPLLSDFDVTLKVTVPGRILKTNAHKKSLYTAVWSFAFDKDPNALSALQKQQFSIQFEGKGLNLPTVSQK